MRPETVMPTSCVSDLKFMVNIDCMHMIGGVNKVVLSTQDAI